MTELRPPVLVGRPLKPRLIHAAAWIIVIQAVIQVLGLLVLFVSHP